MKRYEEFETMVLNRLSNDYVNINNESGFSSIIIGNSRLSVANTVEALLILNKMYKSVNEIEKKENIHLNDVEKFLIRSYSDMEKQTVKKISDLAYCGIGLYILGKKEKAKEILNILKNCKKAGGWGTFSNESSADLYSTFLVFKLHYLFGENIIVPEWIASSINSNASEGIAFLEAPKPQDSKSIEALTIAVYITKRYANQPIDEKLIKNIDNFYKEKIDHIIKGDINVFTLHPKTQYNIFGFGLAAYICANKELSFVETLREKLPNITNETLNNNKDIPFTLELVRSIKEIKYIYDPFCFESSNQISKADIDNKIEETIQWTSINTIFIFVLGLVIYLIISSVLLNAFKISFTGDNIVYIIISLIIELLFDIFGLIKQISKGILRLLKFLKNILDGGNNE